MSSFKRKMQRQIQKNNGSTTKGALIYNSYTALRPSKKILSDEDPTSKKTLSDTSKNFLLNKDSKDNIEKSISKEMEGKAPKKRSYSTILEDPVNKFVKEALSKFIQYCRGKNYTPKELKKPVLLMAQANREAVKNRKKGESPELHDLAESDGVGQNATRVLSLSVIDGTLKISIKKNRYGINNKEVLMIWEVNTGYLKPLLSENPEESTEDKKDDKPDGEQDKGGEKDYGF